MSDDLATLNPWDRLAEEPSRAFAAFCIYRDMPPEERTILGTYRIWMDDESLEAYSGQFQRWAADYDWADRALAFDRHVDRKIQEEIRDERMKWRSNRRSILQAALIKGADILTNYDAEERPPSLGQLTDFIRMIVQELRREYGDDLESKAPGNGQPTIVFGNVSLNQYNQIESQNDGEEIQTLLEELEEEGVVVDGEVSELLA